MDSGDNGCMATYRYAELVAQGLALREFNARVRSGDLIRVRHGGYCSTPPASPEDQHLALVATTVPALSSGSVLSHVSAGLVWGLPVPRHLLGRVHTTRDGNCGGKRSASLHSHRRPLPASDVTERGGYPLTSLARTAVDLACLLTVPQALAVTDAALRLGCDAQELTAQAAATRGCTGSAQARWAVQHADARAESPGESASRYWMIRGGVPAPVLQYEVRNAQGRLLGRADFAWPGLGVLGEFDGKVKYQPGSFGNADPATAIMAEKRREASLTLEGWSVVRWGSEDLRAGPQFARRVRDYLANRPSPRPIS